MHIIFFIFVFCSVATVQAHMQNYTLYTRQWKWKIGLVKIPQTLNVVGLTISQTYIQFCSYEYCTVHVQNVTDTYLKTIKKKKKKLNMQTRREYSKAYISHLCFRNKCAQLRFKSCIHLFEFVRPHILHFTFTK